MMQGCRFTSFKLEVWPESKLVETNRDKRAQIITHMSLEQNFLSINNAH